MMHLFIHAFHPVYDVISHSVGSQNIYERQFFVTALVII